MPYEALLLQVFPKNLALIVKVLGWENHIFSPTGNAMTVYIMEAYGRALIE